jgi:hypothetical protein
MHEKSLYFWGLSKGFGPHTQVFPVFCPYIRLFINFTFNLFFGAKDGSRTRNLQLGRLELYQLSYFRLILLLTMRQPSFNVGTGGFEPPKSKQQIYSLSHLATLVYPHFKKSRRRDSNPRPTDYKSVALPAELLRLIFLILKNVPFKWGCKFNNNFCCCKKKYNFFCFFSKIIALPLFFNEIEKGKPLLYLFKYQ